MSLEFSEYDNLLIELCEDYYLKNQTITDLSKKFKLSRYKLLKYLDDAKDRGLVEISIHSPYSRNIDLENIFNKHFDTTVYILKDSEDLAHQDLNFWRFTAEHIQDLIKEATVISLSWGDSVYKTIDQFSISMREELIFTQFIGEVGKYQSLAGSMRLVQKAANKYEGTYQTISAPLYIFNDTARSLLSLEPIIAKTLATAKQSDMLISGIGTPSSIDSVPAWEEHKYFLFEKWEQAVGLLYGRPFNAQGEFLVTNNDKTFGLSLSDIFSIPIRIGICNSKFKSDALLGALRGNFYTHLFLDEKSALKIISLLKKQ